MGFTSDAKGAISGAFCAAFETDEKLQRWGARLFVSDERADILLPQSVRGRFTRAGRSIFCDLPPTTPYVPAAPTGQCSDAYNITVSASGLFDGTLVSETSSFQLRGPLGYPRIENLSAGVGFNVVMSHRSSSGQVIFSVGNNTYSGYTDAKITGYSATRDNGLPDDCGVVPPIEPLDEDDRTSPININNNIGDILFGNPTLNINGDLIAPFSLEAGDIELSGELVLNKGEINFNFGGQPTTPCPQEQPVPDMPPPNADDDDPEDDKKGNIIGVIVVSSASANITATEIGIQQGPNIFVPRCATVSFKIRIGDSAHWTADIPVKNKNSYIPCPGALPAIDAYVQPEAGWVSTITAVRGIVPANDVVLL